MPSMRATGTLMKLGFLSASSNRYCPCSSADQALPGPAHNCPVSSGQISWPHGFKIGIFNCAFGPGTMSWQGMRSRRVPQAYWLWAMLR